MHSCNLFHENEMVATEVGGKIPHKGLAMLSFSYNELGDGSIELSKFFKAPTHLTRAI